MPIFLKKFIHQLLLKMWRMWYPTQQSVELKAIHIQHTSLLQNRLELLQKLPKQSVGAELGVEYGEFSKEIYKTVVPKELHLVDLWDNEQIYNFCKSEMDLEGVQMHKTDSSSFLSDLADDSLDWVYIDTDHGYEITKKELDESARVVKNNGLICGHDYVHISNSLRRYGVIEAVNEFCVNHSYELLYLTNESHRHLSFALRKMP